MTATWPEKILDLIGDAPAVSSADLCAALACDESGRPVPNLRQKVWAALLRMERSGRLVRVTRSPSGTTWRRPTR